CRRRAAEKRQAHEGELAPPRPPRLLNRRRRRLPLPIAFPRRRLGRRQPLAPAHVRTILIAGHVPPWIKKWTTPQSAAPRDAHGVILLFAGRLGNGHEYGPSCLLGAVSQGTRPPPATSTTRQTQT